MEIIILILIVIIIIVLAQSVKVVPEGYEWVVEFLGKPQDTTLKPGTHFIVPFLSRVRAMVSIKEETMDVPAQIVITKDNIMISITSVVYYKIIDPLKVVYEVEDLRKTISRITQDNIRYLVTEMTLDEALTARDKINLNLIEILESEISQYGCLCSRVCIKDIIVSDDVRKIYMDRMRVAEKARLEKIASSNDLKIKNEQNSEWIRQLKKCWENKDINGVISLFNNNVTYYKNSTIRLYTEDEIKEEWQEILNEDYRRLEFNIIMQDDKYFMLNIIAEERIIHDIVIKIELNSDGKCTYFRKWEENN